MVSFVSYQFDTIFYFKSVARYSAVSKFASVTFLS